MFFSDCDALICEHGLPECEENNDYIVLQMS